MVPIARELASDFRVLEPFQRRREDEPLTVARHVEDLHGVVTALGEGAPPALVGSSWGAMLALAYAAEHPRAAGPLVLVGCGTFDPQARAVFEERLEQRKDPELRQRLRWLGQEVRDADERLRLSARVLLPVYSADPITDEQELEWCDARGHAETWSDMLRLQRAGVYPAAFSVIESPVLMLHGSADPHPGDLIRQSLAPYVPRLEYREWERCGHYPWIERAVRDEFFELLRTWLTRHTGDR